MRLPKNYDSIPATNAGEFAGLPAGGYVCVVKDVKIENSKSRNIPMLVLRLDIAEGEFAGYFTKSFERSKQWNKDNPKWSNNAIYRQNLRDYKTGEFPSHAKGLLTAFEKSNPGFSVKENSNADNDGEDFAESSLKGKILGVIFAEEEYKKQNGAIGTAVKAVQIRSADQIREGNFAVPPLRKLNGSQDNAADFSDLALTAKDIPDDSVPF